MMLRCHRWVLRCHDVLGALGVDRPYDVRIWHQRSVWFIGTRTANLKAFVSPLEEWNLPLLWRHPAVVTDQTIVAVA